VVEEIEGAKDPGKITIDEISGMTVTMALIPATPVMLLAGFLIFRLFDITKPFPANIADRKIKGGLGVMLDDVVAGVYANICLQLLRAYIL
jgi:phosphatidylglycerophosphatase A